MEQQIKNQLQQNKKLFIPFITAGDPTPNATIQLALSLQKIGASAIELGVPYSDPLADGPVIQKATKRALKNDMNIEKVMNLAGELKEKGVTIPIILFTYYNPVLQLGKERFFALTEQNQIDGLIVPDLPFEESDQLRSQCEDHNVTYISMVAPTSVERISKISTNAKGFIYCVSSLGVTGVRNDFDPAIEEFLMKVKEHAKVPVAVGFGISHSDHVKRMNQICDGVVVGSALVNEIEKLEEKLLNHQTEKEAIIEFSQFAKSFVI
ncbi:tryptophan synthase subunit alpha [Metabacillus arenae]|uniref:Tryptophan synthase alpha chain n=1 Tax=Metabacillus arenae TaxID=2771434 RepID=A0A926RUJ7_9BACI|nr:tryptophan synthase subunit alpha [Metabacillus arenae]MBD1378603.1 tryptophan synthase subunit alpha [Metabacillus arenae]